jgi:hypothetical protein
MLASSDPSIELVNRMVQRLPPELCQRIANYCPESLLWRYNVAVMWPPETLSRLAESKPVELSLSNLAGWTRGVAVPSSSQNTLAERKFARIGLDSYGIYKVEFLTSWAESSSTWSPVQGTWYIVEKFGQLAGLSFQSRVKVTTLRYMFLLTILGRLLTASALPKLHDMGYPYSS